MRHYNPLLHGSPTRWDDQRRRFKGGGGGGSVYYENANRLYGSQADTADFLLNIGKSKLPEAADRYQTASTRYFDPKYEQEQVGKAVTDAGTAQATAAANLTRDMARYGINPASGRFAGMMGQNAIQGAAMSAAAANQAREGIQNKQFGVAKDFYSSLVGLPSDAASAAGAAASGYGALGARKDAAAQQEAAGWGTAIGLGASYFRDGGQVKKDCAPRFALGGGTGGLFQSDKFQAPPMPAPAPSGGAPSGVMRGLAAGKKVQGALDGSAAASIMSGAGKGMEMAGKLTSDVGLSAKGLGLQGASGGLGANIGEAAGAYTQAAEAATLAGDTAAAAEFGSAASGLTEGAALAGEGLFSTAAAAIPWVGAAIAVGSLFDLFADGGLVEKREDYTPGGKVDGPGTPTSDSIPAWVSDGEYVLNEKAVKMVGKENLDKINAAGLKARGDSAPKTILQLFPPTAVAGKVADAAGLPLSGYPMPLRVAGAAARGLQRRSASK